jgi:adenylate cyclase class IV
MHVQLYRALKHFCPDFTPIRHILKTVGASVVGEKDQVDYFFVLPSNGRALTSRRLKLRIENEQPCFIYYYNRSQTDGHLINFQVFEIGELVIKDILETVLGVETVVQKHREVWRKDNAIFNLDKVHHVGRIFEVELGITPESDSAIQAGQYHQLFAPYL